MELNQNFPSVAKYMGSKTDVLDLIEKGINYFDQEHEWICDLFAGSATLSAALRDKVNVISNDVQQYSEVFTKTYLNNYDWENIPDASQITEQASERANRIFAANNDLVRRYDYNREFTLQEFNDMESNERELIHRNNWQEFGNYYLFTKDYSGTYWSFQQCVWIDSYRAVIDEYRDNDSLYNLLLACLIYAMAYNSQSTGHYAQYRIPETESSKEDILIYRRKNIFDFFDRKFDEFRDYLRQPNHFQYLATAETDVDCLRNIPRHTLVYADPPYSFVHFSRFYHVLETLVRYDYPRVRYKGRYRTDRYQSDYCIRTKVADAFTRMFNEIVQAESDLILSYTTSTTNTIEFSELLKICCDVFNPNIVNEEVLNQSIERSNAFFANGNLDEIKLLSEDDIAGRLNYEIAMIKKPYNHSRMGRTKSKTIPVTEVIIIAKRLDH